MSGLKDSAFNQAAYDLWSKQYDQDLNSTIAVDETHFPPVWEHISNRKVLEIGCGTGRHTIRLVQLGNHVTGIDISSGMLAIAKAKLPPDSTELIHANFLSYQGFEEGVFDAVITSLVLEHVSDLGPFFQKVAQVLKDGGAFFLSEIHPERIAKGSQANFVDPSTGETIKLVSNAHSSDEIATAGTCAGLSVTLELDVFGDTDLANRYEGWEKYFGKPMVKIWSFRK